VKRQVDGAEEIGEPFGPRSFIGHATRVPADRSIVNPDGSAESARFCSSTGPYRMNAAIMRLERHYAASTPYQVPADQVP
jgi:hypothetical protein